MCIESHRNWRGLVTALRVVLSAAISARDRAESRPPNTYSAEPIEGWVVDADTNNLVEGVIVVAAWILYG